MKAILPYNVMLLSQGGYPEYLNAGDIVRGYNYNEKKIVEFPVTKVTRLESTRVIRIDMNRSKSMYFSGLTKVLTQGGPVACYKASFLLGVCQTNPRQLNVFTVVGIEETRDEVPTYEIEWEDQNFFLWAEGMLVGSLE